MYWEHRGQWYRRGRYRRGDIGGTCRVDKGHAEAPNEHLFFASSHQSELELSSSFSFITSLAHLNHFNFSSILSYLHNLTPHPSNLFFQRQKLQ
jgi:hypothetical protein